MSFWHLYNIPVVFSSTPFQPLILHRPPLKHKYPIEINDHESIDELRTFLKTYFGNPPTTPVLDLPRSEFLKSRTHFFIIRGSQNEIIASIRYYYMGNFQQCTEEIYCIDCFCIHPQYRKKGLADYLLHFLNIYVNDHQIPYSIFLKEGHIIPSIPYYSSKYVYRELTNHAVQSNHVHTLSIPIAYRLLDIFQQFTPNLFIIRNPNAMKSSKPNQIWKLYQKNSQYILVCAQDTYQRKDNKKMGWITAWLSSPVITDIQVSYELSDSFANEFDYIWMDHAFIGYRPSPLWKEDGHFHMYLYQWTSTLKFSTPKSSTPKSSTPKSSTPKSSTPIILF
jgi:hypothetical protein